MPLVMQIHIVGAIKAAWPTPVNSKKQVKIRPYYFNKKTWTTIHVPTWKSAQVSAALWRSIMTSPVPSGVAHLQRAKKNTTLPTSGV